MLNEKVLKSFNRDNLKGLCKKLGIQGYSNVRMEEMVGLIKSKAKVMNHDNGTDDALEAEVEEYIQELLAEDKYKRIKEFNPEEADGHMFTIEDLHKQVELSIQESIDYQNDYEKRAKKKAEEEKKAKAKAAEIAASYTPEQNKKDAEESKRRPDHRLRFINVHNVGFMPFNGRQILEDDGYVYLTREESESFNFPWLIKFGYLKRADD